MYALIDRLLLVGCDREIPTPRRQASILQHRLGERPSLMLAERLAPVLSGFHLARRRLVGGIMPVTPATVVGWPRKVMARTGRCSAGASSDAAQRCLGDGEAYRCQMAMGRL